MHSGLKPIVMTFRCANGQPRALPRYHATHQRPGFQRHLELLLLGINQPRTGRFRHEWMEVVGAVLAGGE